MRYFILGILLLAWWFPSCSPVAMKKEPKLEVPTLAEWPAVYRDNFAAIRTLQSKAQINIESPELSTRFTVQFLYVAPDTLFLQAEGPFGIQVGKIFIGRERFLIYNQYNNQFIAGSLDDPYYSRFLQTDFSFQEIKNVLMGFVRLPENLKLLDEAHGVFGARVDGNKWRLVVNPRTGLLEKREIISGGKVVLQEEFKNYRRIDGTVIPGFVRVLLPAKRELFSVRHTHIRLNEPVPQEKYRIEIDPRVEQLIIQ